MLNPNPNPNTYLPLTTHYHVALIQTAFYLPALTQLADLIIHQPYLKS